MGEKFVLRQFLPNGNRVTEISEERARHYLSFRWKDVDWAMHDLRELGQLPTAHGMVCVESDGKEKPCTSS